MRKRLLAALGVLVLTTSSVSAQTLNIDHQPVGCAVADRFPQLEARFAPAEAVAAARVVFQPENAQHWYAVAMASEGPAFSGVLPKPKKSLKAFRYYIEVTDKALGTNRTAEYTTAIVASPGECQQKIVAAALGSASVLLQVPVGAAALPAGFASTGVVATGSASAAAAAGAGAGGGGGLSTGAVVGIVAGAGAAAAGVVVASRIGSKPLEIRGQVFARGFPDNPIDPVAGAVVSTSLDSATATTDGSGLFDLRTQAAESDVQNCRAWTITIMAAGLPTYSLTGPWGSRFPGPRFFLILSPPFPNESWFGMLSGNGCP